MTDWVKDVIVPVAAIAGVVLVELKALALGIDGAGLMSCLTVIGGVAGYKIHSIRERQNRKGG